MAYPAGGAPQYAQQPQASFGQGPYAQQSHPSYGQPNLYTPHAPPPQAPQQAVDPFMQGIATNMLRQSGENYLQRGQAFMQSKMGFLSGNVMHYYFNISSEFVRNKLLMLLAPYLKQWNYTRVAEQIAGGHKYLPPRQDVNAPDLYIPFMAMCTCCILSSVSMAIHGRFTPDTMYATVSSLAAAWFAHWAVLKVMLYMLGIPSAIPFLEVLAYAGYPFVPVCVASIVSMLAGGWAYHVAWFYGSLCMAVFMVRTMKRIIFHEARQYSINSTRHNYLLLLVALFQFPYVSYLGVRA
ncbi:hypothetical protein WJX72_006228 [[Myrmecia] bisecta]|uniref:Uncharacterized protein n=1 Tax=[Myrmecia] bisecta TaxID=41462 RepID=A0AAW1R6Y2_9CHLO